jgi:GDPmannose 4,6-dehydratase
VGRVVRNADPARGPKTGDVIVRIDPRYFRPTEVDSLLGDATKARQRLGWMPRTSFAELVREMVANDLEIAERDALVAGQGYRVYRHHE